MHDDFLLFLVLSSKLDFYDIHMLLYIKVS